MDRKNDRKNLEDGLPGYESAVSPPKYDTLFSNNSFLHSRSSEYTFSTVGTYGPAAAEAILNRANLARQSRDFWFAQGIQDEIDFNARMKEENTRNIATVNQSVVNRQNPSSQAANQSVINRNLSSDQAEISDVSGPTIQNRFWPIVFGALVGAGIGTAVHLGMQGASTAGGAAVADRYHYLHNASFNKYMKTQQDPRIGASYAGHFNYTSSLAYLNDQKEHAAPWLHWGPAAALNHFNTTNKYDTITPVHWNGYLYQNDK